MASSHVPAWQRFGLKLKFAKENAVNEVKAPVRDIVNSTEVGSEPGTTQIPLSRKRENEDHVAQSTPKRRRQEGNQDDRSNRSKRDTNNRADSLKAPQRQRHSNGTADHEQENESRSRRKSVTFTPETKQEDGFSTTLFKNKPSKDFQFDLTEEDPTPPLIPQAKKSKLKSKAAEQPTSTRSINSDSATTAAYVTYLILYHTDRANWKFNKNKQTDLFKHLFDTTTVPVDLNSAIIAYLQGLRGESARHKIGIEAQTILDAFSASASDSDTNMSNDSYANRSAAYQESFKRELERHAAVGQPRTEDEKTSLATLKRDMERAERAYLILQQVLPDYLDGKPVNVAAVEGRVAEARETAAKKKSRKARTQVDVESEDDSSSSSDDESEESSVVSSDTEDDEASVSDDDDDSTKEGKAAQVNAPIKSETLDAWFSLSQAEQQRRIKARKK